MCLRYLPTLLVTSLWDYLTEEKVCWEYVQNDTQKCKTGGIFHKNTSKEKICLLFYRGADKSLVRPGRKQANVSVRMAWISFGALPCRKQTWWQLASRCCWNRSRSWHASEVVSFLVGLGTYQHPGTTAAYPISKTESSEIGTLQIVDIHADIRKPLLSNWQLYHDSKGKGKFFPLQARCGPEGG